MPADFAVCACGNEAGRSGADTYMYSQSTEIKDLKKITQREAHELQPSVQQNIGSLHGGEAVGIVKTLTINHHPNNGKPLTS